MTNRNLLLSLIFSISSIPKSTDHQGLQIAPLNGKWICPLHSSSAHPPFPPILHLVATGGRRLSYPPSCAWAAPPKLSAHLRPQGPREDSLLYHRSMQAAERVMWVVAAGMSSVAHTLQVEFYRQGSAQPRHPTHVELSLVPHLINTATSYEYDGV